MTRHSKSFLCLLAASALVAPAAFAQDGYIGLTFGHNEATDPEDTGEFGTGNSTRLEGLYRWTLGPGSLVIEGSHQSDNMGGDFDFVEMSTQSHLAAHYVYNIGTAATVSGFIGYGTAPHEIDEESFKLVYGGIGGSYAASPTFAVYGQLGIGDAPSDDTTFSFGFSGGEFARLGVTYTGWQGTALTVEYERAFSDSYEDEEESGNFHSIFLGGVTALPSNEAIQITYGARKALYEAVGDEGVEEVTATLGIRYVFGGKAPGDYEREGILGSPHIPLRASNWTPAND
jgi:hypothetical protein